MLKHTHVHTHVLRAASNIPTASGVIIISVWLSASLIIINRIVAHRVTLTGQGVVLSKDDYGSATIPSDQQVIHPTEEYVIVIVSPFHPYYHLHFVFTYITYYKVTIFIFVVTMLFLLQLSPPRPSSGVITR
jgi:hypothetical protein